jgi:hypothetical protein
MAQSHIGQPPRIRHCWLGKSYTACGRTVGLGSKNILVQPLAYCGRPGASHQIDHLSTSLQFTVSMIGDVAGWMGNHLFAPSCRRHRTSVVADLLHRSGVPRGHKEQANWALRYAVFLAALRMPQQLRPLVFGCQAPRRRQRTGPRHSCGTLRCQVRSGRYRRNGKTSARLSRRSRNRSI